jgi:hypothetical protein
MKTSLEVSSHIQLESASNSYERWYLKETRLRARPYGVLFEVVKYSNFISLTCKNLQTMVPRSTCGRHLSLSSTCSLQPQEHLVTPSNIHNRKRRNTATSLAIRPDTLRRRLARSCYVVAADRPTTDIPFPHHPNPLYGHRVNLSPLPPSSLQCHRGCRHKSHILPFSWCYTAPSSIAHGCFGW